MQRSCVSVNKDIANLRKSLKDFVETNSPDESTYLENLTKIRSDYTSGPNGTLSEEQFQQVLAEFEIDPSFIVKTKRIGEIQLQNKGLSYKNLSKIYQNATQAYGYMKHDFSIRMFKAIFLDNTNYRDQKDSRGRLINDTVQRIPISRDQINGKIAEIKNDLIKLICEKLNIPYNDVIFRYRGKKSVVNEDLYKEILNHPNVINFLSSVKDRLHIASQEDIQIHSALFIINNFDTLVQQFLPKILTVNKDNFGLLSSMDYTKELEGNSPSIWSSDDLTTYGSDLYASNLGKFILSTINKVDSNLKPIEGTYLTPQDSFVIASLLREAEYEYHISFKNSGDNYDSNLLFKVDLNKTLKTLLELGINGKLYSLKSFIKEIYPVYNWLYNTGENSETIGVESIYKDLFKSGRVVDITQVLNLGTVLAGELIKNVAPVYIETTTFGSRRYDKLPVRTINASHIFRGTSYITQNLISQVLDELRLGISDQNQALANPGFIANIRSLLSSSNIDDKIKFLEGDSEVAKTFRDLFEFLFSTPFSSEFISTMSATGASKEKCLDKILGVIESIGSIFRQVSSENVDDEEKEQNFQTKFQEVFLNKKSDLNNSYTNIIQTVADRKQDLPLTIIKNAEGKSIPIYRLGSTIFEDIYLLSRLKKNRVNRGCLNFLVNNTHALSNINNPQNPIPNYNQAYQGATGLRLETISDDYVNPANDSSAKEAYINSFLGDFIGLGLDPNGHTISVQLMTLSDKASIFTKIINLDAIINGYGNFRFESPKSLDQMSNQELQDLYYFYKKNQVIDTIFHIIDTWNKVLDLGIVLPDINKELLNSGQLLDETSEFIQKSWKFIKEEIKRRDIKKPKDIERLLREYKERPNSDQNLTLTKELHFSLYKGSPKVLTLNKNIFYQFLNVKTKDAFDKKIEYYVSKNASHSWFGSVNQLLLDNGQFHLITEYCKNHNISIKQGSPVIPREVIARKIILDSLFRSQIMDLHFKGPYLDAIKNVSNYDEMEESATAIQEADARFKAAGKRTVDLPGTKQNFAQGLIDGVPKNILVSHVEAPEEEVFSPLGINTKLEIDNGAGRIHPIYAFMESASMTGSPFRGINRKTLGENVDNFYSTLYKWAEFLINNWQMRNSSHSKYQLQQLFRKMSQIEFEEDIDLTTSFLSKQPGDFTPLKANNMEPVYFATGLHYYRLNRLTKVGENTYNISVTEVNEYGEELVEQIIPDNLVPTQNVQIKTIYDLFKVFGGTESMKIGNSGKLEYSDTSLKLLYSYVINIGNIANPNYAQIDQSTVHQPLRDKFISVVASNTAIKRGETNTNGVDVYTNQDKELLTSSVDTSLFGAQMDVFHHVDEESTATEPTQTLTALATNGNTREEANMVYNAIASIIHQNMQAIAAASMNAYDESSAMDQIRDLTKDIMNVINENGSDLQNAIVQLCTDYLDGIIPVSDPTFYSAFHSYNIRQLNLLALRRKYTGIGGVLNPSSNTYQLFSIGGQELEYDDLVKRARTYFSKYENTLKNLTTEQIANLYIFSKTDRGSEFQKDFNDTFTHYALASLEENPNQPSLLNMLQQILDTIEMNLTLPEGEIDEQTYNNLVISVGHKITKTEVDPLDTVIYKKGNKFYKITLDTTEKYFSIIQDPYIEEIYLDISTPHDLKPQIIKYKYNGETHSLYESDAGELNYLMNNTDFSELSQVSADNAEEGRLTEQMCKLF